MHPLNQAEPYPYDQWWAAAYAAEIGDAIVARQILGEPVILFRVSDGNPAALSGVCSHRSHPLAGAQRTGDYVRCPYHGFTFDAGGRCVEVPSQMTVPAKSDLRRYPTVERGGIVWLWTGDEGRADPALLPELEAMGLGAAGWIADASPMITIAGRYTLLIDNLMDLSHVSFIHADTIPDGAAVAAIAPTMRETAASLNVVRVGRIPANPLLAKQFPDHAGAVDQHFDAECFGPHLIRTGGTIASAERGAVLGTQNFVHLITPASPHGVHYFVVTTRDFGLDRRDLSAINLAMGDRIQPQDVAAIEAIERTLQTLPEAPHEALCRADTGALKVRHRLARQIAAERHAPVQLEPAL